MFDQSAATGTNESQNTSAPAWQRLHGAMKSATLRRCAWDAEHARHLREAEAMQLWNHFGYVSILEYLEREHGIDPRTANDRLRVSHALGELPMLEANLEDGTFQYSHVKELTRVVTPETEDEWIAAVRGKTCAEVQAMVAGRRKGDGPEDPDDPDLRLRRMTIEMTPQMLALYREQRVAIEAELGHRLDETELWQIILERARACPEGASTPAQISICSHCHRGWQDGAGFRAELDPAAIDGALCDAEHLGSVDGEPGRKTATISDKKRARILARHHHRCAVPGCRSARNLDVHHIVHQEDGGGHDDGNIVCICSSHHRAHHRGQLAIEGRAPDAIRFTWRRPLEEARSGIASNGNQRAHVGSNAGHSDPGSSNEDRRRETLELGRESSAARSKLSVVTLRTQARDALVGLGWKNVIAGAAVDEALAHVGGDPSIDVLIREALRRCPKSTS